jgi:hypothetical protein
MYLGGAQRYQALDFSILVIGVEVKVNAWRHMEL